MAIINITPSFAGAGAMPGRTVIARSQVKTVLVGLGGVTARFGYRDTIFGPVAMSAKGAFSASFIRVYPIQSFMSAHGTFAPPILYKGSERLISASLAGIAQLRLGTLYKRNEQPISAFFAGAGALSGRFTFRDFLTPPPFRGWGEAVFRIADKSIQIAASLAGSGVIQPYSNARLRMQVRLTLNPRGALSARFAFRHQAQAALAATAAFNYYSIYILHPPVPGAFVDCHLGGEARLKLDIELVNSDFIWPNIDELAGEKVLFAQATGMEKALADVDAYRLTRMYAEIIIDQWDPYRISARNLPYLAWATGVNLWETWWSEEFKRYWVAIQWTAKYERGSRKGLDRFITAVGGHMKRCVTPPAKTFPTHSLTPEERIAYLMRFPQLRLYPY